MTNSSQPSTDCALWTVAPRFGVAGGPSAVTLTAEGRARAFSVGAKCRRGASELLAAVAAAGGQVHLATRAGARLSLTDFGRRDAQAWAHLGPLGLGYVCFHSDETGDVATLTAAGVMATAAGHAEQARLLTRCERAAQAGEVG